GISALTGELTSAVIIITMALLSVMLDSVQEHRAGQAAERLRQSVAVRVSAVRDGKPADIPVRDLVPGDVVLLAAGDLIPADGRRRPPTRPARGASASSSSAWPC